MVKKKVFIDGGYGTTGLQLAQRLQQHAGIELLPIDRHNRKERERRLELYDQADLVVLCLPDDEALIMVELAKAIDCRLLDASSAHRCADAWVYGLPELETSQRERIAAAQQVANPGCYASASILLLKPLLQALLLQADSALTIQGYSGYSGGGRQLIERYQHGDWRGVPLALYGLNFQHKHLAEIRHWSGLSRRPMFVPAVLNCYQGMLVTIALHRQQLSQPAEQILSIYQNYYQGETYLRVLAAAPLIEGRYLQLSNLAGSDSCHLAVQCSDDGEFILLLALLDNLGKGASGVALQNINLMLGFPEQASGQIDSEITTASY